MEIILLKDIENLGQEGQTVKVEDGYARNFLIPKKMAVLYTAGAVKVIEAKRRKAALKAEKEKNAAQELAKTISQLSLTIPVEAGVNDTLFGSVTAVRQASGAANPLLYFNLPFVPLTPGFGDVPQEDL